MVARDFGRNPVSLNYAKIKKPGFWENLGLVARDFGRNPVSLNYARIKYNRKLRTGLQNSHC
ncbi:MAG: hypothetical protein EAZ79_17335 [Oscillatoriales cyanobacterium]|nr:MAG: hypothetical protein EAZ79_17335 [Oscillatoriales cyanobacterium]